MSGNFFHFLENVSKRVKLLEDMPADYVIAGFATRKRFENVIKQKTLF